MKKIIFQFLAVMLIFSCTKNVSDPNDLLNAAKNNDTAAAANKNKANKNNTAGYKVPYGTTQDLAGRVSGVNGVTGYEPLVKHLNASGVWDNTYDFVYYDQLFNCTIATYSVNAAYGDPIYAASINPTPANASVQAAPFVGNYQANTPAPLGAFKMNYIVWNPTNISYTAGSSQTCFLIPGGGYWCYVAMGLQGDWSSNGGGSFTVYDFGKFIKTNRVQDLEWLN